VTGLDCAPLQPSRAALQGALASKDARNKGSWYGQRRRANGAGLHRLQSLPCYTGPSNNSSA